MYLSSEIRPGKQTLEALACFSTKNKMIIDSTVLSPEQKLLINKYVGKPFSVFNLLKIGAIGSRRMIVDEYSDGFSRFLERSADLNYCNIELRPSGIILHIAKDRSRFSWIIPYYRLVIFDSKTFSIHSEGHFLKIRRDNHYMDNKKFMDKMLILKQKATANSFR